MMIVCTNKLELLSDKELNSLKIYNIFPDIISDADKVTVSFLFFVFS